jgi:3-phenylpropionate/trans-cinnamate dioxygenase ferredoxin reductase component
VLTEVQGDKDFHNKMSDSVVIVGAGQAASQLVASLRTEGYAGGITIVGDEPYIPYQRPPLSKAFLAGDLARERLFIKPEEFYAEAKCHLLLNTRAVSIDRARKVVKLTDGLELNYTTLALATGSRVRQLPLPGGNLPGVFYLRGIADVEQLQNRIAPGQSLVIVGAGYIGLEVAAVAVKRGLKVTVLEALPRVMQRAACPQVSAFYQDVHHKAGVDIRLEVKLEAIEKAGDALSVRTSSSALQANTVLIGVGIVPNVELAVVAGLKVDNGIVVDQFGRTDDPSIYAIGDCANLPCTYAPGGRVRLESVQNAIDQSKHVAATICGKPKPYNEVPWFWSDQYDLKLQIAGLHHADDELVIRGNPADRSFAAFHLQDGVVVAVEAINAAPEYMMGRRLIAARARVAPGRLADKAVPMKDMA